jgi:hypothetical protein
MVTINAKELIFRELQLKIHQLGLTQNQIETLEVRNTRNCRQLDTKIKRLQGEVKGLKYAMSCCLAQEAQENGCKENPTLDEFEETIEEMLRLSPK